MSLIKKDECTFFVVKIYCSFFCEIEYYCEKQICMRSSVTELVRESVGLCSHSRVVRDGIRVKRSNLVNKIPKISYAHNLHVKMLDFARLARLYVREFEL